jgi:hypothetical protein
LVNYWSFVDRQEKFHTVKGKNKEKIYLT